MKRHLRTLLGVAVTVVLLAWTLRGVSPAAVLHDLGGANFLLLGVATLVAFGGLAIRAVRWGVLLLPAAPRTGFRPRFASVVVGFAANNLIPARVGEFARAFSLARLTPVPIGASLATLVVERVFDAFALVVLLFVAMASAGVPAGGSVGGVDPRDAAQFIALAMAGVAILLFLLVLAPERSMSIGEAVTGRVLPRRVRAPVVGLMRSFVGGLAVLRSGRLFALSLVLAFVQWLFTALSFVVAFSAFGIHRVPFAGAVFLQSLVSLAVAVPSSPGFFGPFEAAARLGLALWGVPSDRAVSFAIGLHLSGFIPVTLLGLYYVWRLKLSWSAVRHGGEALEDAARGDAPPPGAAMSESL
ncbi:MAG TPA: lysylphosphatidylglycerol synthase transmembrane domain-containing protein [Longimicrobiaceae bacterium]|nr:lysylphosphatidylglycerol synthase transmembrane domain-containing protein [Longimicrobiaceae bacterium]